MRKGQKMPERQRLQLRKDMFCHADECRAITAIETQLRQEGYTEAEIHLLPQCTKRVVAAMREVRKDYESFPPVNQ